MNPYNEQLEELMLHKSYAELSPNERAYVSRNLGDESAYTASRALRIRSNEVLRMESAPADPGGLAAVMARTQPRRPRRIPIWQAAAAVLLAVAGTWMIQSMLHNRGQTIDKFLAQSDTLWQEIRVIDTVYLPAPQAKNHPVAQSMSDGPKVEYQGKPIKLDPQVTVQLAEALANLPNPATMGASAGGVSAPKHRPETPETFSDRLLPGR